MENGEMMTVGELAKKMKTTVRTLQYYDKEQLLKPSAISEGGRRLYTNKDMLKLHQILSMKYLGFSLDDIKNHLMPLDTPDEVLKALDKQAASIREQIDNLNEALFAIKVLEKEIKQINKVDFKKYAEIIELLRLKNEYYWVLKFFNDKTLEHIKNKFTPKSANQFNEKWKVLCHEISLLKSQNEAPGGIKGQQVAKKWWDLILEFTGGDMSLLPELMKFNDNKENWDKKWKEMYLGIEEFINKALSIYFQNKGIQINGEEFKNECCNQD